MPESLQSVSPSADPAKPSRAMAPGKLFQLALCALFLLATTLVGLALLTPPTYQGEKSLVISASPETVWATLTEVPLVRARHPQVMDLTPLPASASGNRRWEERMDRKDSMVFEQVLAAPPRQLTLRMLQSTFGMTGVWHYRLEALSPHQTRLTVSEKSELTDPAVRLLMTFVGRDANLRQELQSVQRVVSIQGGSQR